MLIRTKNGIDTIRLKKGKHWVKCLSCGMTALRGNSAKQCHRGGRYRKGYKPGDIPYVYDCDRPVVHMPETCRLLGGACAESTKK